MNYRELLDKYGKWSKHFLIRFNMFSEERMLEFAREIDKIRKELDSLGDDLTQEDYDRVYKLVDKYEWLYTAYRSMGYMAPDKEQGSISPQLRLMGEEGMKKHREFLADEKFQEIIKGIKRELNF